MDINFYCSKSRANKKGDSPITISVVYNKERILVDLPFKYPAPLFEKEMNSKKGGISRDYCQSAKRNIEDYLFNLQSKGKPIDIIQLKEFIKGGCASRIYTLADLYADFIKVQKPRVGFEIKDEMILRYEKAWKIFIETMGLNINISADAVDINTIILYRNKLLAKYKESTMSTNLNKIKAIFKYGFETGKLSQFPFSTIKIRRTYYNDIKYLTQEQLTLIKQKSFDNRRLKEIADCFLFQCYSGLAWIDLANLVPEDFKKADNGLYYIKKKRIKTGIEYVSILFQEAISIALFYDFKLPVKSNQKYNQYLKEIAAICNLCDEDGNVIELTTHMARHSYAIFVFNKLPDREIAMKVLGHTDPKINAIYAKILDKTIFEKIGAVETEEERAEREFAEDIIKNKMGL